MFFSFLLLLLDTTPLQLSKYSTSLLCLFCFFFWQMQKERTDQSAELETQKKRFLSNLHFFEETRMGVWCDRTKMFCLRFCELLVIILFWVYSNRFPSLRLNTKFYFSLFLYVSLQVLFPSTGSFFFWISHTVFVVHFLGLFWFLFLC